MSGRALIARRAWLALVFALLLWPRVAEAHQVGLSRGEYVLTGDRLAVTIGFAHRDLATAFPALDTNGDGALGADELRDGIAVVDRDILGALHVTAGANACPVERVKATIDGEDALLEARATCVPDGTALALDFGFLAPLPAGHRHLAHVRAGKVDQEFVALLSAPTVRIDTGVPITSGGGESTWSFFVLGIEHILTGYDHLVFLFGLVVVAGRARALVKAITAFTVAHSMSLAAAVLGVWTPSPRFVEPAIALSIAYVGVENFFLKDAEKRWRITLPFGLVHGFGFAGALVERHLPRSRLPLALLGFNGGVEVGQLAVMALVLPLVLVARRREVVRTRVVPVANGIVVVLGLVWLVLRILELWR